jgi:peptidoglycan/xylan/chitin deacetylase (PgdA/CDA1 family)
MKQMHHIKKWYDVITIDELSKRLVRKERFHKPSVIITIDDGYLNNYTIAYPILKELNLPAIIYLTAGCIGTNKGLWIDDIEYALIHAKVNTFSFEELFGEKVFDISTLAGKKETEKILYSTIHRLENLKRAALIKKLFENLHVDISELEIKPRIMLNWDEIIEMSRNGISFGAHTLTHPCLPALQLEDAKHEIKRSKALIEEKVGKTIKHFAVPNGTKKDFTPALKEYCAAIGFDSVVMTESGVVMSHADPYELSRTIPPPPLYYFACEVAKYFFTKEGIIVLRI